jgi:hypothetical protein
MELILKMIISALQNWYIATPERMLDNQSDDVISAAIQLLEDNTKGYSSQKILCNSELVWKKSGGKGK